jgi:hypothetical protein
MKQCPLLLAAIITSGSNPNSPDKQVEVACITDKCGWWCASGEECSIAAATNKKNP